jgi:hypothetical protein
LMLPPGLRDSVLANTVHFKPLVNVFNRMRGVSPIVSRTLSQTFFIHVHQQIINF